MEQTPETAAVHTLPHNVVARIHDLSETATICLSKRFQIPEGWVIIGETVLYEVPGPWPNGWIIKRPAETEIVCSVSPIPENYVTIEHVGCEACPGVWPNAWKIERLVSPMDE
jgi:alpha-D-ribose 1-methylphosphonate 5-phosphate C-P lyase